MRSKDLTPGTQLRHVDGTVITLAKRKGSYTSIPSEQLPGWWLTDGGGLGDWVIDDDPSDWTVLDSGRQGSAKLDQTPTDPGRDGVPCP